MPETRLERAVFVLGLVAIAALVLVIVGSRHGSASGTPRSTPPVALSQSTSAAPRTATTQITPATTASTSTEVELALTADQDSWVEVRAGSATAAVLFSGTLSSGTKKTFRSASLWARFGSASNLAAKLDGKPLELPAGTYSAVFDPSGFRRTSG
jgi:RodZ C-terminal domain